MEKYLKAYEDIDFIKRNECRAVRLQLEHLKPDLVMTEQGIRSTIVLFGSARTWRPEYAEQELADVQAAIDAGGETPTLLKRLKNAEHMMAMSGFYTVARQFAALVSSASQMDHESDFVIMTGGGGGIMEAGNRGAADVGAKSIGLNITLPFEQAPNEFIPDELIFNFHYFSIRKMHFLMRAKALCAFPGGYGTLDELFETLTLVQTRKIQPIPVVLFGREFWEKLINWQLFADMGLISPEDLHIFHYSETPEDAWDYIRNFWNDHRHDQPVTSTL